AHAGEVDAPGLDLDEEQNVVPAQKRRIDREEVARHGPCRLRPQEIAPARPPSASAPVQAQHARAGDELCWARPRGRPSQARQQSADSPSEGSHARDEAPARTSPRRPTGGPGRGARTSNDIARDRSKVCGVTSRPRRRPGGSRRLAAARNAQSLARNLGRSTWRCRTSSWWRSTISSTSLTCAGRPLPTSSFNRETKTR